MAKSPGEAIVLSIFQMENLSNILKTIEKNKISHYKIFNEADVAYLGIFIDCNTSFNIKLHQ